MLTIQRASAGSGKTFKLAKTYIELFLTITNPETGQQRLRTDPEIADSLKHILAVTFTNKATAEMKERIVEKLAALASAPDETEPDNEPDYMEDLCKVPGASRQGVIHAAQQALRTLLLGYSDFNVSTIDSFFQSILRTFAYETDISDSYQLEIDRDYTATVGVDTTLDKIISNNTNPQITQWLRLSMENTRKNGHSWNAFQRRASKLSLYSSLLQSAQKMENEEFKKIQEEINEYFESEPDLIGVFQKIDKEVENGRVSLAKKVSEAAALLKDTYISHGIDYLSESSNNLGSQLDKSIAGEYGFKRTSCPSSPFRSKSPHAKASYASLFSDLMANWFEALQNLRAYDLIPEVKIWNLYKELLPNVPMLHEINRNLHEYLESSNALQISDTNTLLQRIIGDDDTPFIYERMGTLINHFLIDEFQDTSKMQWENFRPLLSESESRKNANLIIGDAKQSIYRFRNADPSLISKTVPDTFPSYTPAGNNVKENTNWRSLRNIVEFNNVFFHALATLLGENISTLYSNVVQHPNNREPQGYVELNLFSTSSSSSDSEGDEAEGPSHLHHIGEMVTSLLARGYRQKDIAFLTVDNAMSLKIVDTLIDYNSRLPEDAQKIEFISDQSLLIGNAHSVKIILAALNNISKGLNPNVRRGKEAEVKGSADWYNIASRYDFLQARYPDLSPDKIVKMILEDESQDNLLSDMISEMQSVALPSLVEALIEGFVHPDLRKAEGAFLAAFQDTVLAYCESNSTDIASFLDWWNRHPFLSITSPQDIDAVSIMTIHKSKGLEFDVVIIPSMRMNFSGNSSDWHWVKPHPSYPYSHLLPPYIPIVFNKDKVGGTPHENDLEKLIELEQFDTINKIYVAFTRAVRELYVWCPIPTKNKNDSFSTYADTILSAWPEHVSEAKLDNDKQIDDLPTDLSIDISTPDDGLSLRRFTFGAPLSEDEIRDAQKNKEKKKKAERTAEVAKLTEYQVNSSRGILKYRESDFAEIDDLDDADNLDPRAEGTLMHKIMESVSTIDDLDASILRLKIRGIVSDEDAEKLHSTLSSAMKADEVKDWFSGKYNVINERSIIRKHSKPMRPDRIMISPTGEAIVVDYKFGQNEEKAYHKQVADYAGALLQSRRYKSVKAFIWYVTLGKIVPVDLDLQQ